jgi:hypothetical protein
MPQVSFQPLPVLQGGEGLEENDDVTISMVNGENSWTLVQRKKKKKKKKDNLSEKWTKQQKEDFMRFGDIWYQEPYKSYRVSEHGTLVIPQPQQQQQQPPVLQQQPALQPNNPCFSLSSPSYCHHNFQPFSQTSPHYCHRRRPDSQFHKLSSPLRRRVQAHQNFVNVSDHLDLRPFQKMTSLTTQNSKNSKRQTYLHLKSHRKAAHLRYSRAREDLLTFSSLLLINFNLLCKDWLCPLK